jgi:hypothetical protein
MSEKKEGGGGGVGIVILLFLALGFLFQREKMNQASENLGRFIGALIILGTQKQQQQNTAPMYVPTPVKPGSSSGATSSFDANPFANSTFKWNDPGSILPERDTARCVTGFDSMGRVVTECESN